jgi:hypothetical protein
MKLRAGMLALLSMAAGGAGGATVIPGQTNPPAVLAVYQNLEGQLIASVSGYVPACGLVPQPGDPTYAIQGTTITVTQPELPISCPTPPPDPQYFYSVVNFGRVFNGNYTINWNAPGLSQQYVVQGNPGAGPEFSGNWYDTSESGHGFTLEVLPGTPPVLLAYWFVFQPGGGEAWIAGTGPITNNTATLTAYQIAGSGAQFPPHFDPGHVAAQAWGTLTFTFTDCNDGRVDWASTAAGYGSGSLPLSRLTLPAGLACP